MSSTGDGVLSALIGVVIVLLLANLALRRGDRGHASGMR
jgi:hypothetical protein